MVLKLLAVVCLALACQPGAQPAGRPAPDLAQAVGRIALATPDRPGVTAGTCFWISADEVVTCWQTLRAGGDALIEMPGDRKHRVMRMVGFDERAGVAIVRAEPPFEGTPLALSAAVPSGREPVRLFTSPLVSDEPVREGTLLRQHIDRFYGPTLIVEWPKVGRLSWSGAPIVGSTGEVVGIVRSVPPAKALGAPVGVIGPLRAGEGEPFAEWDRTPRTRHGRALHALDRALARPDDADAMARLLTEAVEESPDFWVAWTSLGILAEARGDRERAIECFGRAAPLSPTAEVGMMLADSLRRAGRVEEGAKALGRAMKADIEGFQFLVRKDEAFKLAGQGRIDEALPGLAASVDGMPDHKVLRSTYAQCLAVSGRAEEALRQVEALLELDPRFAPAYYARGVALGKLGKWTESIEPLSTAIELDPTSAPARLQLGQAYLRTGNISEAVAQQAELEKLHPQAAAQLKAEIARARAERGG